MSAVNANETALPPLNEPALVDSANLRPGNSPGDPPAASARPTPSLRRRSNRDTRGSKAVAAVAAVVPSAPSGSVPRLPPASVVTREDGPPCADEDAPARL